MKSLKVMFPIFVCAFIAAFISTGCNAKHNCFDSVKRQAKNGIGFVLYKTNKLVYPGQDINRNLGQLDALGLLYGTDKTMKHHYTEIYEDFLCPLKNKADKILEIGIADGASLKMWKDYFPHAIIYGIDIVDESRFNSNTIKTFVADQADRIKLQKFINSFGSNFDFILDDGGHSMEQQQVSFGFMFKHVKPGGFYIIEDVHTSIYTHYGDEYGATINGEKTTLAMIDNFIRTGTVKSDYMTPEEKNALTAHIEYCNLFSRDNGMSITCIFRKKIKSPESP
jgi:hypothetical protein